MPEKEKLYISESYWNSLLMNHWNSLLVKLLKQPVGEAIGTVY
jgi:hypothetical protein